MLVFLQHVAAPLSSHQDAHCLGFAFLLEAKMRMGMVPSAPAISSTAASRWPPGNNGVF